MANIGHDTAYAVRITATEYVIGTAPSVPPYRTGRLASTTEPPCYVNFCVPERLSQPTTFGTEGPNRSAQNNAVDPIPFEVVVRPGLSDKRWIWLGIG